MGLRQNKIRRLGDLSPIFRQREINASLLQLTRKGQIDHISLYILAGADQYELSHGICRREFQCDLFHVVGFTAVGLIVAESDKSSFLFCNKHAAALLKTTPRAGSRGMQPVFVTFFPLTYSALETPTMLYLTIGLFALAAVIGVLILRNWLTAATTSRTVVYAHGAFAALALVLLLIIVLRSADPSTALLTSLALFVMAALGGFYMFFLDLKGKMSPTWLAFVHGALAVGGFLFLLFTIL